MSAPARPAAVAPFAITRLPRIEFGAGSLRKLPDLLATWEQDCPRYRPPQSRSSPLPQRLLLVTGRRSFMESPHGQWLRDELAARSPSWEHLVVEGEPSPQFVDEAVARLRAAGIDAVVGIGGGSVLDAAKAVAGLLVPGNSVMDHLEGVGPELPYRGPATPFVAVPTTAGTGSEATKNAVLSVCGPQGFKKSFRDDQLVARWAVVDPDLLATCPPDLIAADGMDAFTQLLESFVSGRANPFTDALALSGLASVRDGLLAWHEGGAAASQGRAHMAYAALLSGICLAQTGLGAVHGLASPLGAFFPIPHGVVCGTLVEACTRANIDAMLAREPDNAALARYAQAGRLLRPRTHLDDGAARGVLLATLADWTRRLELPRLSAFGMCTGDIPRVVENCRGSSMKTNPVLLSDAEVARILKARL
ncbi:MAG: iron-containing alcohol dehydrogenase [Betaproteobacteria bacterium]|nr:iron-containing alcohol dehydrogenase [Betaproteobacteria bacterium]